MITLALRLFATREGGQKATNQRNPQHFCNLASAANAAGIKVVDSKANNTQEEIVEGLKQIRKGIEVKRGSLKGRTFKLPKVSDDEITGASRYIAIEEGDMIYSPSDQWFFASNALMLSADCGQFRVRHQYCCN